jgi:transposase
MTSNIKYVGMDVHKESISMAVRNAAGKIVMECVIETKANTILQFFDGLRGDVQVTFEEGTAWLHDLLKPHVGKLVVCDPRRNALLQDGNQNDRVDARKLSDLLYMNKLNAVYHGDHGLRTLKELVRSYLTITRDLGRVMTRVKAIYRSWAIPCSGKQVYGSRHRAEWLGKINEPGVRLRAEFYYQQLDTLRSHIFAPFRLLVASNVGQTDIPSGKIPRCLPVFYWPCDHPIHSDTRNKKSLGGTHKEARSRQVRAATQI